MKAWIVILGAGVAVVAGGLTIARDLMQDAPRSEPVIDWRPAKQVTFATLEGGTQTMRFQPDRVGERAIISKRLADFDVRWSDALSIVGRTPRMSLAVPALQLQALAREGQGIQLTECLEPARVFWSGALDAQVRSVLAFMANDREQATYESQAKVQYSNWEKAVDACD